MSHRIYVRMNNGNSMWGRGLNVKNMRIAMAREREKKNARDDTMSELVTECNGTQVILYDERQRLVKRRDKYRKVSLLL